MKPTMLSQLRLRLFRRFASSLLRDAGFHHDPESGLWERDYITVIAPFTGRAVRANMKLIMPLEAKDVPIGSAVGLPGRAEGTWFLVQSVTNRHVCINASTVAYSYETLMRGGWLITRDGGKTWEKCEKEAED